jgi:hypothetical protein
MIGNDAKARAATAMAKERDSLREGLQLTTIGSLIYSRFWGFVAFTPFFL